MLPLLVTVHNREGRFDARDETEAVCWRSVSLAGFVGPKAGRIYPAVCGVVVVALCESLCMCIHVFCYITFFSTCGHCFQRNGNIKLKFDIMS